MAHKLLSASIFVFINSSKNYGKLSESNLKEVNKMNANDYNGGFMTGYLLGKSLLTNADDDTDDD